MSTQRIIAIISVFLLGVTGWVILGSASASRSTDLGSNLGSEIRSLWGGAIVQKAPVFYTKVPGSNRTRILVPDSNNIKTKLDLEHRRKGLIWYPTFDVDFDATYQITNPEPVTQKIYTHFSLPEGSTTYDVFSVYLDGVALDTQVDAKTGVREIIELKAGETRRFRVSYSTRGLNEWRYHLVQGNGRINNLLMQVDTNFQAVDFSRGSLSPMLKEQLESGMSLTWKAEDLITAQHTGIVMPELINPGPLSARMTFFAPVCLLFFFVLITSLGVLHRVQIHPMHYLFVTSGFFAFHLLFAYLIDLINVHLAFILSAGVSLSLVTFYLFTALGKQFPWRKAFFGQLLYLILFSYSFFLEGMTGLTVTIGSIITLAVLMKLTATVDWSKVFSKETTLVEEKS